MCLKIVSNIYTKTSEKMIILESKVTKIYKSVKGYIDGKISEVHHVVKQGNVTVNSSAAWDPENTVEGFRNEVIQLQ